MTLTSDGPQTRLEIATKLRINRTTVGRAVDRLNDLRRAKGQADAVEEIEADAAGLPRHELERLAHNPGENPTYLALGGGAGCTVGIEVAHTHLTIGISDPNGRLIGTPDLVERAHSLIASRPASTFKEVAEMVKAQIDDIDLEPEAIRGAGVSVPAPVGSNGRTLSESVLKTYVGVNIPNGIRQALHSLAGLREDLPVVVSNDVDVLAHGEQRCGIAFRKRNFAVVKCSGGIGAAIVSNDKVLGGFRGGGAAELGHLPIRPTALVDRTDHIWKNRKDPVCQCGQLGHLEAFVGGEALLDRIAKIRRRRAADGSLATRMERAIKLAREGDELHSRVFADAAALIGVGVNALIHVSDPEVVLITGRLSELGDEFLKGIRDECHAQGSLYGDVRQRIHLGICTTTEDRRRTAIRGAAITALRATPPRIRHATIEGL